MFSDTGLALILAMKSDEECVADCLRTIIVNNFAMNSEVVFDTRSFSGITHGEIYHHTGDLNRLRTIREDFINGLKDAGWVEIEGRRTLTLLAPEMLVRPDGSRLALAIESVLDHPALKKCFILRAILLNVETVS